MECGLKALERADWLFLLSVRESQQVQDLAFGCVELDCSQLLIRRCAGLTDEIVAETNGIWMSRQFEMVVVLVPEAITRPPDLVPGVHLMDQVAFSRIAHPCLGVPHAN
jgi:hypothetical protein